MSIKNTFYLLLVTVLPFLMSCNSENRYGRSFNSIADLVDSKPDSAFFLLDSIRENDPRWENKAFQMWHHYYVAKAHYKAYQSLSSDSMITEVVRFFSHRGGRPQEQLESMLYAAVYKNDSKDVPQSIVWYKRAADFGEEHLAEIDTNTLCAVYSQLEAQLFMQSDAFDMLHYAKRHYALREGSKPPYYPVIELARAYENIYENHPSLVAYKDSAYSFYVMLLPRNSDDVSEECGIKAEQLKFFTHNDYKEEAQACMRTLEGNEEVWPLNAWATAGDFQYKYESPERAKEYWLKALEMSSDIKTRNNIHFRLFKYYTEVGDKENAVRSAEVYMATKDSIEQETATLQTLKISEEYTYHRQREIAEQNRSEVFLIYKIFGGVIFLTLVSISIYAYNNYREMRKIIEERDSLRRDGEIMRAELEKQARLGLMSSDMLVKFKKAANDGLLLEENDWKEMHSQVTGIMLNEVPSLLDKERKLSDKQLTILCLLKLGLRGAEIGRLFDVDRRVVQAQKNSIKDILKDDWGRLGLGK